jgi:hypothetical protein
MPRCAFIDQQHQDFEEYKKREKKRTKKKEYVQNKKCKIKEMKMPCKFDHDIV